MIFIRTEPNLIEQARTADMLLFLKKHCGFTFTQRGGVYRCQQHLSLAVKADRLSWYWHSKSVGGYGALDFLMKIEHLPFRQAVETVATAPAAISPQEPEQPKPFILPEKGGMLQSRLIHYLCRQRGIDTGIVSALLDEGSIYEDKRCNVVFVGFDENGKPRFASLRGTYSAKQFRMDCAGSDKRYGFHMSNNSSARLYIFESPIDVMSHASLENMYAGNPNAWRQDNRLSLAGTSDLALPQYLKNHPHTKELVLCLDSDQPGRDAAVAISRKYTDKGYHTRIELPTTKDYNEDLLEYIATKKANLHTVRCNELSI